MSPFHCLLRLALSAALLFPALVLAANNKEQVPTLSAQQAVTLVAALKSGEIDRTQLPSLPPVEGADITRLTSRTGLLYMAPGDNEDFFAFGANVGKKHYIFWFTVSPRLPQDAATPALAAILEHGRVTQYQVIALIQGRKESNLVACRIRSAGPGCGPSDADSSKIRQPGPSN